MDRAEVLWFINAFSGARATFLHGCCYWFGRILQERFGGRLLYCPVEGHFVTEIGSRLYDVTGDVTAAYADAVRLDWVEMASQEPLQYARIVRDCVDIC